MTPQRAVAVEEIKEEDEEEGDEEEEEEKADLKIKIKKQRVSNNMSVDNERKLSDGSQSLQ